MLLNFRRRSLVWEVMDIPARPMPIPAIKHPESYDNNIPDDLVYSGSKSY